MGDQFLEQSPIFLPFHSLLFTLMDSNDTGPAAVTMDPMLRMSTAKTTGMTRKSSISIVPVPPNQRGHSEPLFGFLFTSWNTSQALLLRLKINIFFSWSPIFSLYFTIRPRICHLKPVLEQLGGIHENNNSLKQNNEHADKIMVRKIVSFLHFLPLFNFTFLYQTTLLERHVYLLLCHSWKAEANPLCSSQLHLAKPLLALPCEFGKFNVHIWMTCCSVGRVIIASCRFSTLKSSEETDGRKKWMGTWKVDFNLHNYWKWMLVSSWLRKFAELSLPSIWVLVKVCHFMRCHCWDGNYACIRNPAANGGIFHPFFFKTNYHNAASLFFGFCHWKRKRIGGLANIFDVCKRLKFDDGVLQ